MTDLKNLGKKNERIIINQNFVGAKQWEYWI